MDVRSSPIAGRWYPGNAADLRRMLAAQLNEASTAAVPGEVLALLAPHAGLMYSGPVAAHAFKVLSGRTVDTVIILCPSHFHADGALITSGHSAYRTPLGEVAVDQAMLGRLRARLAAALAVAEARALVSIRQDQEHAIEIELPFLQTVLAGEFALVPIMLRDQSARTAHALGRALAESVRDRRALIVASSDLAHYCPQAVAERLDAEMLRQVEALDPTGVLQTQAEARGFACGHGAIAAALWAAQALGAKNARLVRHATSGEVSGDYVSVVGYGAAVIWK